MGFKRGDWVRQPGWTGDGLVRRVARDGSWADVRWRLPHGEEWTKRMPISSLEKTDTIRRGGMTITVSGLGE
jgi:hypothetical protein